MSKNPSKDKGNRHEYNTRDALKAMGFIKSYRVELSGAGREKGDVIWVIGDMRLVGQCKHEKDGFARIYKLLDNHGFTAVKADRKQTIFSFTEGTLAALLNQVSLMACEAMSSFGVHPAGEADEDA